MFSLSFWNGHCSTIPILFIFRNLEFLIFDYLIETHYLLLNHEITFSCCTLRFAIHTIMFLFYCRGSSVHQTFHLEISSFENVGKLSDYHQKQQVVQ
jgi:hypothetical protein